MSAGVGVLVPVFFIIFQGLNLVLDIAGGVFGFADGLELFAMACVVVDASLSTMD